MATIVYMNVPAEEFALSETLHSVPDLEFECERLIEHGGEVVMPLMWARTSDHDAMVMALDDDSSIQSYDELAAFEDEWLYHMEWVEHVRLVLHMLVSARATILDAYGRSDGWHLRVLYPNRDDLSRTHEFCESYGLTFDVERVREMTGKPAGRFGLTDEQYEALTLAWERGYFDVPRTIDLHDLAEELGISHQALSERLRRGHTALIEDSLLIGSRL